MQVGLITLCLAYVLSQFFRAFLAVLSGVLAQDIGTTPDDLSFASGLWFLSFAAMQIPVGWALDRIGPRRTAWVLLLIGGAGGAAVFGWRHAVRDRHLISEELSGPEIADLGRSVWVEPLVAPPPCSLSRQTKPAPPTAVSKPPQTPVDGVAAADACVSEPPTP